MEAVLDSEMPDKKKQNVSGAIKEYGRRLFGFIRGRVRSEEDAEDLMQDVWYQFSNISNIDELENISAWLYRVARNRITDYYRKKRNSSLEDVGFENDESEFSLKDILLIDDTDPDLARFRDLFWNELGKALAELPENQRSVFVLNELEDMTLQEIADKQGENIKTITSRKGYAVKHLRSRLQYLYDALN
jgi:RNA polymerase sigma factor (sigma-70 family)